MGQGQPQSPRYKLSHATALTSSQQLLTAVNGVVGRLLALFGFTDGSADAYVQIHDTAAIPAAGAVPIISIKVQATDSNYSLDLSHIEGTAFQNGAWLVVSDSPDTYVASAVESFFSFYVYEAL